MSPAMPSSTGTHVGGRVLVFGVHPALLGRPVKDREVELLVSRIKVGEKVEHFVDDFVGATLGLVDLVDGHDGAQADFQSLGHNKLGLRHRAFRGINQHDGTVDHLEDTFHLTAKVGVAGRIDDIDTVAIPFDRGRLGENGDAALALDIIGIHRAFDGFLVFAICAGLFEQFVDQRCLAVVNVGDDRDITHFLDRLGHRDIKAFGRRN